MDMRPCLRSHRAALAVLMVLGLTGCGSVYTIYSIDPGDTGAEPSTVPDISGLWAVKNKPKFFLKEKKSRRKAGEQNCFRTKPLMESGQILFTTVNGFPLLTR